MSKAARQHKTEYREGLKNTANELRINKGTLYLSLMGRGDFSRPDYNIKRSTEKALRMLLNDPHHPSLHIKKTKGEVIKGYQNVFEGRITKHYRFLFLIESGAYVLLRCGSHDEFFK